MLIIVTLIMNALRRRAVLAAAQGWGWRGQSQPLRSAIWIASARLRAPSFWIAADRWLRTVPWDRCSDAARSEIAACPRAADSTSVSRAVSGLAPSARAAAARAGATTHSPAYT